ncbi:16S rRNA (uracil(1498)-N(3))-methyltransferase [Mycoplasmopsis gallinarum]
MHRFFVNKLIDNSYFELENEQLKHIKVARLEKDHFLCNYRSIFYECYLENNRAYIVQKLNINHEYQNEVILAAPIIKIKRFEWILQKATELGVTKIIPLISHYTDKKLVKYELRTKWNRFEEIIKNAAEQSFRNIIPELLEPQELFDLFKQHQKYNQYLAYENTQDLTKSQLKTNSIIYIGPEGGFSKDEVTEAQKFQVKIINLGKTILRAETACLAALANIDEN